VHAVSQRSRATSGAPCAAAGRGASARRFDGHNGGRGVSHHSQPPRLVPPQRLCGAAQGVHRRECAAARVRALAALGAEQRAAYSPLSTPEPLRPAARGSSTPPPPHARGRREAPPCRYGARPRFRTQRCVVRRLRRAYAMCIWPPHLAPRSRAAADASLALARAPHAPPLRRVEACGRGRRLLWACARWTRRCGRQRKPEPRT
jgi:hypothetical protein